MELRIDALVPPADRLPGYAPRRTFRKLGASFVRTAADHGLRPDDRVLDLGCGVGRFAVAFAEFANDEASYEGLDIVEKSIDTCDEFIGSKLPNFNFQRVNAFNSRYNPDGDEGASTLQLPFEDSTFDFVFSNSLFTHLIREDTESYLHEIGRVLRPGGITLNTFFLLNSTSLATVDSADVRMDLPHVVSNEPLIRVKDPARPEAIIAFDESFIRDCHTNAGLAVSDPVRYGSWSGRTSSGPGFGNKDIVVAVRR